MAVGAPGGHTVYGTIVLCGNGNMVSSYSAGNGGTVPSYSAANGNTVSSYSAGTATWCHRTLRERQHGVIVLCGNGNMVPSYSAGTATWCHRTLRQTATRYGTIILAGNGQHGTITLSKNGAMTNDSNGCLVPSGYAKMATQYHQNLQELQCYATAFYVVQL